MFKKLVIWFALVLIASLAVVYFARNKVVAWAIEEGGTYALGVETHLGSANLSPGAGSLELHHYKIDNPKGYPDDGLMSIDFGMLAVNTGSVFGDTIQIDSLVLSGIQVNMIQKDDKGNFTEVLNYARSINYDTSSSGGAMVKIKKLAVRDVSVAASLKFMNSVNLDKSFKIEDITLTNVGGDNGASIGEVTSIVLREIMRKAVVKGRGELSDKFGASMKNIDKNAIEKIGDDAVNKIKDISGSLLGGDKK